MAPIFDPDRRKLICRSDIGHKGRISAGAFGMPIANGRLGGPVWQSAEDTLSMQLNHTDVFTFSDSSSASKEHTNVGGGCIGRVHISFGGGVFDGETENHLSLYDGKLSVKGVGVSALIFADMEKDAVYIVINDERAVPEAVTVDLTMPREPLRIWGEHRTVTELSENDGVMLLSQTIEERCDTGIACNDYCNTAALAVRVMGRKSISVRKTERSGRSTVRTELPAKNGKFAVIIGGAASMEMERDENVSEKARLNALFAEDAEKTDEKTAAWWADFWERSYVYLPSKLHFEKRRNYYLYLSAISNRGKYPSKYNGGIWCGEEDRRDWGSFYWNWNQDSLYQGLISANHMELLEPMFCMRERQYENYRTAARQMFGAEGIYIPETCGVLGWEILPEKIAESVTEYYTFKTNKRSDEFTEFSKRRNAFLSVHNWNVFGGDSQASFVSHSLVATQETAEYFWQRYCVTKDVSLLEKGYKFIKGAAELYRTYDGFRRDSDGKYHIYNTNLHEHIWAGKDCIDDLALARGVFSVAAKASEILGVDGELREKWRDCLENIAPYPLRGDEGTVYAASTCKDDLKEQIETDSPAFAQGSAPYFFIRDLHGTESPIFKMLEKYDVLTLESKDQEMDGGAWDTAVNTYIHSPGYVNQVKNARVDQNGSSRFHIDAARLGMGDDLGAILDTQYHVFSVNGINPNRIFDQRDYYSIEGYGTFAAALHEGLCQSVAPTPDGEAVIRVFPAWPLAWDAKYKLLAKDGFLVSSSLKEREVEYVEITSGLGGVCRIRNPWDTDADMYVNGKKTAVLFGGKNELFTFDTEKDGVTVLVKHGDDPDTYRSGELFVTDVYTVNDDEKNIVYGGKWEAVSDENAYAGDCHITSENGAYAEYTFAGSGVEVMMITSPAPSEIEICIDGEYKATVSCRSDETVSQSVWGISELTYEYLPRHSGFRAKHTVKIVKKSGMEVKLDGFKIKADNREI